MPKTKKTKSSNKTAGVRPQAPGIAKPTEHDVLQGRGGQANNWIGNKTYRANVDERKAEYVQSQRIQKTAMSRELVRNWREKGGRFLEQDETDGLWYEIGDKRARRKTSQLLRENAPNIRGNLGIRESNDSGAETSGDSQDEWLPKGAKTTKPKAVARCPRRGSVNQVRPSIDMEASKPPATIAIATQSTNKAKANRPQSAGKSSPAKKKQDKKYPTKRTPRNQTRGSSFISKKDIYDAIKGGLSVAEVASSVAMSVTSKPTSPLRSSPTQLPANKVVVRASRIEAQQMGGTTDGPSPQTTTEGIEGIIDANEDPYSPQLLGHEPPNDGPNDNTTEHSIPPVAMEPMAFGASSREMSWDIGPFIRPLLDEDNTEPSFFLDLEHSAINNAGDPAPGLASLDVESGENDPDGFDWEDEATSMNEDPSDSFFSLLI